MTSVGPIGPLRPCAAPAGGCDAGARFYDEHVLADQHHQRLALDQMVVPFVEDDPAHAPTVVFGARALAVVEGRFTSHLLECWRRGASSLRRPLAPAGADVAA